MSYLASTTANDLVEAAARLRRLGADGLFRHALPKQQGGHGDGFADLVAAHETLGLATHDPGLILAANAHIWGALFPLLRFGNEAQQQEFLPFVVAGEWLGGHAITEPEAGSETAAMRCRAVADGDGFLLDGRKRYITNTPIADLLVVYARLDDAISAFLVRRDDPGASFAAGPTLQGCATATMGDVILEECRLPANRLLGRLGAGGVLLQLSLELERAFVFAGIGGVMQWQLAEAVAFANRRQVKARPLAAQQSVAHRIAEMKLRLETVRLWVRRCAERCDAKQRITIESAATKWYASEVFLQSSLDAVHIFGAHGLEGGLVALVQDAMASRLFSGSTEIQKNIVAAMIGLNMHDAR
jgi:alkylation response protein AidB-like acyl-CoA dehydrogenase